MRWNTGTGFLVLGLTLLVSTRSKRTRRTQIMCVAATTIAILGGLFTFSGHVFHADLRLDQMVLLVASVWVLAFVLDRSGTEKAAPRTQKPVFPKPDEKGRASQERQHASPTKVRHVLFGLSAIRIQS
jgi:hypothetical protein